MGQWCMPPWHGELGPMPGQADPGPTHTVSPPSLAASVVASCSKGCRVSPPRVTWMQGLLLVLIVLLVKFNLIIINKEEFIYTEMPTAGVVWG